jgi:hypothetical protein
MFPFVITKNWAAQKPPLGSQLNLGHPLAQGLVFCSLSNKAGRFVIDLANSNNGLITGALWKPTTKGQSLYFSGTTNDYAQITRKKPIEPSNDLTLLTWINISDPDLNYNQIFSKDKNTWDEPYYSYNLRWGGSGSSQWGFNINVAGTRQGSVWAVTAIYNKWQQVVAVRKGTNLIIYINTKQLGAVFNAGLGAITYYNTPLYLGYDPNYASGLCKGYQDLTMIYNRGLSPQEIISTYQAPYQMIIPQSTKFYSIPATAGVGKFTIHRSWR